MTRLEFDPRFSMGNVAIVVVWLVTVSGAYYTTAERMARLSEKVILLEQAAANRAMAKEARDAATDERIRRVEIAQASQSSDLRAIQSGISRIESQLEKLMK